jgi:hypothetical protein
MDGIVILKKPIISSFGCEFPAGVELTAEIDSKLRIFVEHPAEKNLRMLIDEKNIAFSHWNII